MNVLRNEKIPLPAWRELLERSPYSTPFQTPEWYELFNSVFGLSADAIAVSDNEHLLTLVVITFQKEQGIKGYFSRRGIIYGGPLLSNEVSEANDLIIKQIDVITTGRCIYVETRNFNQYSPYQSAFFNNGWKYLPYLNFQVHTGNMKSISGSISSSRMRQIRNAKKNGAYWKEATDLDEVKVFYSILAKLYKEKIGKPVLPWEFFREFYNCSYGKYLLVWNNNEIIGGIMCPFLKYKAIYEFYICGLDNENKEQYPSVMSTWAAIEYANLNGIPIFDFMGAGLKDKDYGVRDFKARFGGELVEFGRYIKVQNRFLYNLGKLGLKASKLRRSV
jgi:hypothetical protein